MLRKPNQFYLCALATALTSMNALATSPPAFEEVSGVIESNLVGMSSEELNDLAVKGLISELAPRVTWLEDTNAPTSTPRPAGILEARVYRETVGYVRFGKIEEKASDQLLSRLGELRSTNRLSGLVLDLRKASGEDYEAAEALADLFLSEEKPLMNWGDGLKRSVPKENAITLPVAVLVNRETGGNAEALAAVLRQTGVALLIGSQTAGTAGIQEDFPLSGGGALRITVSAVQLGDAQQITADGIKPDIVVELSEEEEARLKARMNAISDDHAEVEESETNSVATRPRMNEADLVRHWRGEMLTPEDFEVEATSGGPESQDPALLRALDLMEGLAILRSWDE